MFNPLDLEGPFLVAFYLCIFWMVVCFIAGVLTNNVSQVDKLWNIVPWIYCWIFALYDPLVLGGPFNLRLIIMSVLPTIWGLRLSYNFARKGGFSWIPWRGEEDYRWQILREGEYMPLLTVPFIWHAFHLFFICIYQHIVLMLIVWPVADAYRNQSRALGVLDALAGATFVFFLGLETLADNQQFVFYSRREKERKLLQQKNKQQQQQQGASKLVPSAASPTVTVQAAHQQERGAPLPPLERHEERQYALFAPANFNTRGLFAWSRHPNFLAEQALWVHYYLFAVASTQRLLNFSLVGSLALIFTIFWHSTTMTEWVTRRKYPEYKQYQKAVPCLAPAQAYVVWAALAAWTLIYLLL